jgi:hypothetical protein
MMQGHSFIFSHDALERHIEAAINLIAEKLLQSSLFVLFVGPKGEMNSLMAETKRSSTVLGRAFVVIQWLLLLQQTSPHCFNIPEEISNRCKWEDMDDFMRHANAHIIKSAQQVTREEDMIAEDGLGADIAESSSASLGHRTTQNENVTLFRDRDLPFAAVESEAEATLAERATEGNADADGNGDNVGSFPLRRSLVTNQNMTQDCNACRKVQLNALAKEFLPVCHRPCRIKVNSKMPCLSSRCICVLSLCLKCLLVCHNCLEHWVFFSSSQACDMMPISLRVLS